MPKLSAIRFCPLDGQQRLTTLFLLHWYLAWADGRWNDFTALFRSGPEARFSYSVRPSSNEFFNELVRFCPACKPQDIVEIPVSRLIRNQSWYFRSWRLDPTVQSTLVMLDAIHSRFSVPSGLFDRLLDEACPAITFQLLDLKDFGLSDELFIKMNARGKPLTAFETFKARYEEQVGKQFITENRRIGNQDFSLKDFIARRMDTTWSDLFWAYRDKETNTYDSSFMNLLRVVALVTRNPESNTYWEDVNILRRSDRIPSYSDFDTRNWLDKNFTMTLVSLLEAWSGDGSDNKGIVTRLPDERFFNEQAIFHNLVKNPVGLSYPELVQFAAYSWFLREHEKYDATAFLEWMRIVHNLAVNSYIARPDELRSCVRGLYKLLPKSHEILHYLSKLPSADGITGFRPQQVREETLKASLILANPDWRPLVEKAESHSYFRGQIGFLLDFAGVLSQAEKTAINQWPKELHAELQAQFALYLAKAQITFNGDGLAQAGTSGEHLWKRALLVMGDYLVWNRNNRSFLTNPVGYWDSWKGFLRDGGKDSSRSLLKGLWDRIQLGSDVAPQLRAVIIGASGIDEWRAKAVKYPRIIDYCERQEVRWISSETIYLLKKQQMNGAHVELFSFALHEELSTDPSRQDILPLEVQGYYSVTTIEIEPRLSLSLARPNGTITFAIRSANGRFKINVWLDALVMHTDVQELLVNSVGFAKVGESIERSCTRSEINAVLRRLALTLKALP